MSSISDTILEALAGAGHRVGYQDYPYALVDTLTPALEAREREIFDCLVEAGVGLGVTRHQMHTLLVEQGLAQTGSSGGL